MTTKDSTEILKRLDRIERDLAEIKVEMAETRGAYRLAKFIIAFLGLSGLGGLTAWLSGQGK
jgi:streptomycin 6-kinase